MKRIFSTILLSLTIVFGAVGIAAASPLAGNVSATPFGYVADAKSDVCSGVGLAGGSCGDSGAKVTTVIQTVINILTSIVGVVAVVMIIISGFKYITAGGDSNGIASAKRTLIYALVGLVVVALAQVIVRFVLYNVH